MSKQECANRSNSLKYSALLLMSGLIFIPNLSIADARGDNGRREIKEKHKEKKSARERAERLREDFGGEAQIGTIEYAGPGCPANTVATVISPDRKTVSILFDAFSVTKSADNVGKNPNSGRFGVSNLNFALSSCELRVPLLVPAGVRARISDIDVRGFMSLPENSRGGIIGQAQIGRTKRKSDDMNTKYQFKGPLEDVFVIQTKYPAANNQDWTACGVSDIMSISTSIFVKNNNKTDDAMMSIDSADFVAEDTTVQVAIELQPCNGSAPVKKCNRQVKNCR